MYLLGYNVRYIIQNYTLMGTIRNIIPRVLLVVSVPPGVRDDKCNEGGSVWGCYHNRPRCAGELGVPPWFCNSLSNTKHRNTKNSTHGKSKRMHMQRCKNSGDQFGHQRDNMHCVQVCHNTVWNQRRWRVFPLLGETSSSTINTVTIKIIHTWKL